MIEVKTNLRDWGNSLGVTIPKYAVEELNLKSGESIKIFITVNKNVLKETFGTLKIKKSTQELMDEIDAELYNE